jgi:DNA-binding NarL/FixJ family response regulator
MLTLLRDDLMKVLLRLRAPSVFAQVQNVLSSHFISFETVGSETVYTLGTISESIVLITDHQYHMADGIQQNSATSSDFKTLFIVDSNATSADKFIALMEAGVNGIIDSHFSKASLLNALHEISEGMGYICPRFAKSLLDYFQINKSRTSLLSEKEHSVVRLLVKGDRYAKIADTLGMSINTVRFHVKNIYRKHKIHNKTVLSRYYNTSIHYQIESVNFI